MKIPWRKSLLAIMYVWIICLCWLRVANGADDVEYDEFGDPKTPGVDSSVDGGGAGGDGTGPPTIPKAVQNCDGIYISYNFMGREKEYPHLKNATAQSWAFKAQVQLVNMGSTELKSWKVFIGFQHRELLVSADGAVLVGGDEFPADVGVNGTTIAGYPQADLKTAIDTAGDFNQISVRVGLKGTMFGVRPPGTPMPKTIKLENDGFKCPYCCRNGTVLPKTMNESESRSIFQLQVFKLPPDLNRTALYPPQNWRLTGVLNPDYKCGPPRRVEATEFPDPSGLQAKIAAVASWQVVCNITKPKEKQNRCCVSFSAYYNGSSVPCNTCACGCDNLPEDKECSTKAPAMLLPSEALLVPFDNRTAKAKAWAKIKHLPVWDPMPCPDNCGVSINWHVDADYKNGWTARMTLFNWGDTAFEDWFVGVQLAKASKGYEKAYSFNGTLLKDVNDTIFLQGLKGLNYLIAETNGSKPSDPRVPGKQQSVISFTKKLTWNLDITKGDGFPTKVLFNGEECALPRMIPAKNAGHRQKRTNSLATMIFTAIIAIVLITNQFF